MENVVLFWIGFALGAFISCMFTADWWRSKATEKGCAHYEVNAQTGETKFVWNGGWSGEGKDFLIYKNLSDKFSATLGFDKAKTLNWHHRWDDGWSACVTGRVMNLGEKKKESAGFAGYDWMVQNIICYGQTDRPVAVASK